MHYSPTYLDVGFEDMLLAEQNGDGRYDDDYHQYLMKRDLLDENDLIDQDHQPEFTDLISQFKEAIFRWTLYEAATPVYLEPDAPVLNRDQAALDYTRWREETKKWMKRKISKKIRRKIE